jgi:hypothetical protein
MQDPWYSSPVFVVPVLWICFFSGILWASQPWRKVGQHPADEEFGAKAGHTGH